FYKPQTDKTFVISNTAKTAQLSFIQNQQQEKGSILLHSKFKKSDKKQLFEEVYDSFKRDGTNKYRILRSGPIVQASLNISCDYMVSEMTTAENILQRLGRLNRFGLNKDTISVLTIAITDSVSKGKCVDGSAKFLHSLNSLQSAKAWYDLLAQLDEQPIKLAQLYQIYTDFYQSEQCQTAVRSDLLAAIKTSINILTNKVNEPLVMPSKKAQTEGRAKISKNSLRGDNRFVQMAVCDVNNPTQPVVLNRYTYQFAVNDTEQFDNLTESLDTIRNYGLVDYMAQRHARIDKTSIIEGIPANKVTVRKILLENFARDPEYPLYLSYTPDDLLHQLGEKTAPAEAI
nr:CRISPR-associated endonuclease Cas3'' [Agitococcus sp.]